MTALGRESWGERQPLEYAMQNILTLNVAELEKRGYSPKHLRHLHFLLTNTKDRRQMSPGSLESTLKEELRIWFHRGFGDGCSDREATDTIRMGEMNRWDFVEDGYGPAFSVRTQQISIGEGLANNPPWIEPHMRRISRELALRPVTHEQLHRFAMQRADQTGMRELYITTGWVRRFVVIENRDFSDGTAGPGYDRWNWCDEIQYNYGNEVFLVGR